MDGLPRFVGSVAGVLGTVGLLIVASVLAGYPPEALGPGVFALVWAVICGMVAVVVWGRGPGGWSSKPPPMPSMLRETLSATFGLAGLWMLAASPMGEAYTAPPAVIFFLLAMAGLSWLLARHFSSLSPADLTEAPALARWGRIGVWLGAAAVLSELGRWWDPTAPWAAAVNWAGGLAVMAIAADVFRSSLKRWTEDVDKPFPLADLAVVRVLGSRANPVSSILDAIEGFLGVDLRGSWALRVVREGAEPLVITALFVGWLGTSLTQVHLYEQGVVERFGRMLPGALLEPGLHVHLPWPIDRVRREATARVLTIPIGHEGTEPANAGPENVLWARQHESNEFMFLLGDGRDLVTIDASVKYKVRDLRAYLTSAANAPALLRSIVYAAVTHRTVDRSLDQVLSENLAAFTHDIAVAVQADADALGLGVEVVDMTVGGMHPPVVVAAQYEAVVSAQVERDTLVIGARAGAEREIPAAQAAALDSVSKAQADAMGTIAAAKGEAESFRGIRASFAAEPELFQYRRRLEVLEGALSGRRTVVVDDRLERNGAELWLTD